MIFNSVSFKNNFLTATAAGLAVMTALTVNGVHSLPSPQTGGGIAAMRLKNAQDALALDTAKTQVKLGDSCTTAAAASGVICAGDLVATCTGGVVTLMSSCSAGLKCQVLPLLNKPGTSPR